MSRNPTTVTAHPGTPFIDVVREFEATPAQVFRASTDPARRPTVSPREDRPWPR
jgi:hypothetical protein